MYKKLFVFLMLPSLSLLFASAALHARAFTLSELIETALENQPTTKQAWWNAKRAAAALGSAKSSYYPQIGLQANLTNGRDFKFINGPDTDYTLAGTDVTLSMLLLDFGERSAKVEASRQALIAANWQFDWTIQKVMIRVLENAYSTLYAQDVYQAALTSLEEAKVVLDAARELNRAGLTPISDVYTSLASFSEMKMHTIRQEAQLDIQRVKLAVSIGLPDMCVDVVPIEESSAPSDMDISQLIALAFEQRKDLLAKQASVTEALARQKAVKNSYNPKFSLSARGGSDHFFNDKSHGGHYQVRIDFEYPLFTGFDAMYKNRQAFADTKISLEELAELELSIAEEVFTHSRTLKAAQLTLPVADEFLQSAVKAYEGVLEKYKAGKESITDLSIAQQQLAEARVKYSDVKTKWWISLANLAYSTGTLIPYMEKKCVVP